ncbi:MAG TPA: hypothetical protein VEA59_07340 [Patescibacteria group bacterium]|nr:hypothetical protein [Patescibacteria group bacterium]
MYLIVTTIVGKSMFEELVERLARTREWLDWWHCCSHYDERKVFYWSAAKLHWLCESCYLEIEV